jgi:hypothetical protein
MVNNTRIRTIKETLMTKSILIAAALFTHLSAEAAPALRSECRSNGNPWVQDLCTKEVVAGTCDAVLSSNDQVEVKLSAAGRFRSAPLTKGYEAISSGEGWTVSSTLNFGGLVRGMAKVFKNERSGSRKLLAVEVYVNHDASGKTYTRYKCR